MSVGNVFINSKFSLSKSVLYISLNEFFIHFLLNKSYLGLQFIHSLFISQIKQSSISHFILSLLLIVSFSIILLLSSFFVHHYNYYYIH